MHTTIRATFSIEEYDVLCELLANHMEKSNHDREDYKIACMNNRMQNQLTLAKRRRGGTSDPTHWSHISFVSGAARRQPPNAYTVSHVPRRLKRIWFAMKNTLTTKENMKCA